jgi:hypothetical protein
MVRLTRQALLSGGGLRHPDQNARSHQRPRLAAHRAAVARARAELAAKPESFLFSKQSALLDGEESRGQAWGEHLGAMVRHT